MKISHNGEEWHGTFGLTLRAMVDDLLSDGVSIGLELAMIDPPEVVEVEVVRFSDDGAQLVTINGSVFDLERVMSAEAL